MRFSVGVRGASFPERLYQLTFRTCCAFPLKSTRLPYSRCLPGRAPKALGSATPRQDGFNVLFELLTLPSFSEMSEE